MELTDEKITRPSHYIAERDGWDNPASASGRHNWGGSTVKNILSRPEYMGRTVNFRTYKDSYKDRKHKHRPQEEWLVFDGTQEPIVDAGTWETAQKCRKVTRRRNATGVANPLTGLVYCGECGSRMYNHLGALAWKYDSQNAYLCNQYAKYPRKCTAHYIKTSALRTLALDVIKRVSGFAMSNGEEFTRQIREASELRSAEEARERKERLAKSLKRSNELDALIKRLYEDKVTGSLSEKRFEKLSGEYEDEQEGLESQIVELNAALDRYGEDSGKAEKFLEIARRYTDFTELTPAMLNEFVDKIIVHEAVGVGYNRTQRVEIFLNFVGDFRVPGQEEAEPKPLDPIEHRREIWRNYYHRHKEKIHTEQARRAEAKKAAKLAALPVKTPEEIKAEKEEKLRKHREYQRNYQREWQRRRKEKESIDKIAKEKVI